MKTIIVLLVLMGLGCAEQPKMPAAKVIISTEKPNKPFPVSDKYGRHTLPGFVNTNCGGTYDSQCEKLYIDYFGQKLISHYNKTHFAVHICSVNPYVCSRDWNMEEFVRNYGVL